MTQLEDTAAVAAFMEAFGQTIRTSPTTDIPDDERLLRARLVLEEAMEFVEAMGCTVTVGDFFATKDNVEVDIDHNGDGIDIIEATDAIADLIVVVKGSALTLGVPGDDAFQIVHATNMAKLGPDGHPIRRESDGKVLKPEGWEPPTEGLRELIAHVSGDSQTERPTRQAPSPVDAVDAFCAFMDRAYPEPPSRAMRPWQEPRS